MERAYHTEWVEAFKQMSDSRKARGKRYPWWVLLTLLASAMVSGQTVPTAIHQWVREQSDLIRRRIWPRVPSAATLRRALQHMPVAALQAIMQPPQPSAEGDGRWAAHALDGKTVRGATTHGQPVHVVREVLHGRGAVLHQQEVDANTTEIPVVQHLLAGRDVQGIVITVDALHTQQATIQLILRQGGQYLLIAKANQPTLYQAIAEWFAGANAPLVHVPTYITRGSPVPLVLNLAVQLRCIVLPFLPALTEIRCKGSEHTRALRARRRRHAVACIPRHRLAAEVQGARDIAQGRTLGDEILNRMVALLPPFLRRLPCKVRLALGGQRRRFRSSMLVCLAYLAAMTVNKAVEDMTEILKKMKPVRYLLRAGCALADGLCVPLSTVAAHHAHLRMCPQPCCHRRCLSIGEEVNHLMPDLIDDDGAVGLPRRKAKSSIPTICGTA